MTIPVIPRSHDIDFLFLFTPVVLSTVSCSPASLSNMSLVFMIDLTVYNPILTI